MLKTTLGKVLRIEQRLNTQRLSPTNIPFYTSKSNLYLTTPVTGSNYLIRQTISFLDSSKQRITFYEQNKKSAFILRLVSVNRFQSLPTFIPKLSLALHPFSLCAVLSCSVVSDCLRPHRLQPARLLYGCSSGKNTGVGYCVLHQEETYIIPIMKWMLCRKDECCSH